MPTFLITGPDGRKFRVTGDTAEGALAAVKAQQAAVPPIQPLAPAGAPAANTSNHPRMGVGDYVADTAKGTGRGLLEGTAGLGGWLQDAQNFGNWAGDKLGNAIFGQASPEQQAAMDKIRGAGSLNLPTTSDIIGGVDNVTGGNLQYDPKSVVGQYGRTVGSFIPAALSGGVSGVVKRAIVPGIISETAGQVTEGTNAEPYARAAGAFLGAGLPSVARKAVTPFPTSTERTAAVNTLRNEGVTSVTAGQATGSNKLRYMEGELGGQRGASMMDAQGEQFTRAALSRAGINAPRATPEVIDGAFRRIGGEFDHLAQGNTLVPDQPFVHDLGDALTWYADRVSAPNRAPIIIRYAHEIQNAARNGAITGEAYQSLRSRIAADARSAGDHYVGSTLHDLVESLDDAMERSIAQTNPTALGAWQQARRQYRNMLVLEKAATGAGENAALGIISPAKLREATVGQNRRGYARGQGDFADLARSGVAVMSPLPQSGSAGRLAARTLFNLPAVIGGIFGGTHGGIEGGIAGSVAGAAVPSVVGRGLLSAPGRRYLGNQAWLPGAVTPFQAIGPLGLNTSLPLRGKRVEKRKDGGPR